MLDDCYLFNITVPHEPVILVGAVLYVYMCACSKREGGGGGREGGGEGELTVLIQREAPCPSQTDDPRTSILRSDGHRRSLARQTELCREPAGESYMYLSELCRIPPRLPLRNGSAVAPTPWPCFLPPPYHTMTQQDDR